MSYINDYIPNYCERCFKPVKSKEVRLLFMLDSRLEDCGYYVCEMCYIDQIRSLILNR